MLHGFESTASLREREDSLARVVLVLVHVIVLVLV